MQRFIKNSRTSSADRPANKLLSPIELTSALHLIVKTIQSADFKDDINKLKTTKELSRSSPIISLSPFLDKSDILRVGGRLDASNLSYEMKHQIILPYNDPIVKLILVMLHNENHHCGPQTLLNTTRERGFWIIKGKTMAIAFVVRRPNQKCINR
ncbi:uncharacterized protein LOC142230401 [Haematobia irritans]|uniref:uncharacterized protein LOC142230401 n=1 Tax=Haematobia irritans TaxID=7368 RepID=UPI003F4F73E3